MSKTLAKSVTIFGFLLLTIWILLPDQVQSILYTALEAIGMTGGSGNPVNAKPALPLEIVQSRHTIITYVLYAFIPVILYFAAHTARILYDTDSSIGEESDIDLPFGITLLTLLATYAFSYELVHNVQQMNAGLSNLSQYTTQFGTSRFIGAAIVAVVYIAVSTFVHDGHVREIRSDKSRIRLRCVSRAILLTIFSHLCYAPIAFTIALLVHAFLVAYTAQFGKINEWIYPDHFDNTNVLGNIVMSAATVIGACLLSYIPGVFKITYMGTYGAETKLFSLMFPTSTGMHKVPFVYETAMPYIEGKTYLIQCLAAPGFRWQIYLWLFMIMAGCVKFAKDTD